MVVFATLDLQRLNERLGLTGSPSEATVMVTDRRSTIVAMNPDGARWLGESLATDPITRLIGDRNSGVLDYEERGGAEVCAFERVLPIDSGLTVRVWLSKTNARAAGNWVMYRMLLSFSLVALVVILGVKVASDRLMLQPITELTKATRRLAAGDLAARAASSTTIPELHELGKDFDVMAAGLEEREAARLRAELERKDLEQQYHQAQKMDAVGRLAGGIAHDFNNMLTAILGYCELLLEDPAVPDAQREDIREIEKAGKTAAQLTRQLLAFSRREIVAPTIIDLNAVVTSVERMLHRLVGEHISMEARLAADLHAVKADRGQVEQVILNLALNARDAMPEGGRMLIETANVHLDEGVPSMYLGAPSGDYVLLSVSDNGTGITPDVLPHLFEPFFTTKSTGKGTGLGLATIYGIVKQNNGGILVDSLIGGGSVFRIYFPRCEDAVAAAVVASPEDSNLQEIEKVTIVVVEDDDGIRELSARVLERNGYRVLLANGGEEARNVCDRYDGPIHVLLSDVVMPVMNGPAVAAMLTLMRPDMKVVFMSGYTDDTVVRHGVMARDVPFLQKPFTPEQLANKIAEVLG